MTWLDPPQGPGESALRHALAEAANRTGDEIARRRVWTRIASPFWGPGPRPWLMRLAVLGVVAAGTVGALLVWPHARPTEVPTPSSTAATVAPPSRPLAAPAAAPAAEGIALAREVLPVKAPRRRVISDGPTTVRTRAREQAALRLWNGTQADLEPNSVLRIDRRRRPAIEKGRVSLAVPAQKPARRLAIIAGPYLMSVAGTRFHLEVTGNEVGLEVEEGEVDIWRKGHVVRVGAGESWKGPSGAVGRRAALRPAQPARAAAAAAVVPAAGPTAVPTLTSGVPLGAAATAPAPAPAPAAAPASPPPAAPAAVAMDRFREAQVALGEGKAQRALELLEGLARGHGPSAENAGYEVGRVLRDHLLRPRQAVLAWNRYRTRFPTGVLRAETDLSIIETLWTLHETSTTIAEAEAFLRRHPDSERRGEIAALLERIKADSARAASRPGPASAAGADSPGTF